MRKTAESNLYAETWHILTRGDLKEYKNAKFLNLVKLGNLESSQLTLSLPKVPDVESDVAVSDDRHVKKLFDKVIHNIFLKSNDVAPWNDGGALVFKGKHWFDTTWSTSLFKCQSCIIAMRRHHE